MEQTASVRLPSRVTTILSEHLWLQEHAEKQADNTWHCKTTGVAIQAKSIGRTIWERLPKAPGQAGSGYGEVDTVIHIWCPECQPEPSIQYGDGIYFKELMEVETGN
ncbi:MAG TPA: hypothetical protein PKD79_03065 [Candidatus Doudnabacteria bacterium]|nr:hypothetical protein [Candidatus Doudnabacteria bacterium]